MARRTPRDAPDTVWHVTGRVNWRTWHLHSESAYRILVARLREALDRYGIDLLSLVVMSNHYHFVVRSPGSKHWRELTSRRTSCRHRRPYPQKHNKSQVITQFMRDLKLHTANAIQEQLDLEGHFWDGPHHRRRVEDGFDLTITVAYDHRNPVKQGMVGAPELYPRSSAAWWFEGRQFACPLATRSDFPFFEDRCAFRDSLLAYQHDRRLEDVFVALDNRGLDPNSARGRALLDRLLREAGIRASEPCGSAAAP